MKIIRLWSLIAVMIMAGAAQAAVQIGADAPNFVLKDSQNVEHSLADFKGKIVVLEWFNKDCPYIKKFYKNGDMQRFQKEATDQGVIWLQVGSSAEGKQGYVTAEEADALRAELDVHSTAYLLDAPGEVGRLYGAKTTPHMYVIDAEGKLAYMGAIDSISSADSDDISKATNYVQKAIAALQAGEAVEHPVTTPYGCGVKYSN